MHFKQRGVSFVFGEGGEYRVPYHLVKVKYMHPRPWTIVGNELNQSQRWRDGDEPVKK